MTRLKREELIQGASVYGNKGALWKDEAHILYKGNILCGNPGMANNHAKDLPTIGCQKCIERHYELIQNIRNAKLEKLGL